MISIEKIGEMFGTERPCSDTLTIDEFKACVETSRNMISVDAKVTSDMDMFSIYHIVEPKDGAIIFHNTGTLTLLLNPSHKYYVSLYDRNFILHSNNPEIVPKSGFTINEKVWAPVYVKAVRHQKMNTKRNPCETDQSYSYQNCVMQRLVSNEKCKPYWLINIAHDRICSNVSEMQSYFIQLQSLKTMDDESIFEKYKCKKPCTFMEYKVCLL